jgi:GNAT acetyltransferase
VTSEARQLLEIQVATSFVTTPAGRLLHANDPARAAAPRLLLSGCAGGNVFRLRADVDDRIARKIAPLVAQEPPLDRPGLDARFAERYRGLLGIEEPLTPHHYCVIHRLPHGTRWAGDARVICQGTPEGEALWTQLSRVGLPAGMVEMGFTDLSHFWAPWCVALDAGEVAAIAFAARLGETGAEIGVATVPAHRGRGYAAAVTAAWSALPMLRHRALFYATHRDNHASQHVIARLGLPLLGASLQL